MTFQVGDIVWVNTIMLWDLKNTRKLGKVVNPKYRGPIWWKVESLKDGTIMTVAVDEMTHLNGLELMKQRHNL